jgi:rSAM/selenodomain-associated transferase 2/rSAM/selenodomain-associated transferase 1
MRDTEYSEAVAAVGRMDQPERLIVFTRWPTPGATKTRLIPALGSLRAAELQRRMTLRTVETARRWAKADRRQVEVRHKGGRWRQMRRWLGAGFCYRRQQPGDLGHSMGAAFTAAFSEGCRRVVLIGTDTPDITANLLDEVTSALDNHDLVIGPALDGGYWLIGMKRPLPLFDGIAWSTHSVLKQTLELAARHGLRIHLLPDLGDVDVAADLGRTGEFFDQRQPVISVVIPARNEAGNIEAAIRSAEGRGVEIIVVDGDSSDGTAEVARKLGHRVIHSRPGRARQQNAGAVIARADTLLFLHADTILPHDWSSELFESLLDRSAVGGGFLWRADANGLCMRIAAFVVRLRTIYHQEPWGDQAIFVRKADFHALGGFPDVPIAEDRDFVRTLRRTGRIVSIRKEVLTSARRWRKGGLIRGFVMNRVIVLGCYIGLPRRLLARLY